MQSPKQFQQIEHFLKDKERILLLTHRRMDGDALGSILATYLFLKKLGKEVTAVCDDAVPSAFLFLPTTEVLNTEFSGVRDFIVTLNTKQAMVDKMKYTVEDDKVNIIISPKEGSFSEKDISFQRGDNKYDLVIILDCPVLEQLGKIYENNVELFYSIPIVGIDHHVSNMHFGHINLVDVTAASTTEILFDLFLYLQKDQEYIDKDIATLLLAGIITDTGSFKNSNTTPKCLEIAADLYDLGADQQEIIKHIYKTKHLTTLKLWGRALSKLQIDTTHRIVWTTISQKDLKETEASEEDTEGIIDELISNAPGAEVFVLMKELEERLISVSIRTVSPQVNAIEIASLYNGGGHLQAAGCKIKNFKDHFEAEAMKIIESFREYQKKRLGLSQEFEIPFETVDKRSDDKKERKDRKPRREHEVSKHKDQGKAHFKPKKRIDVLKTIKEPVNDQEGKKDENIRKSEDDKRTG